MARRRPRFFRSTTPVRRARPSALLMRLVARLGGWLQAWWERQRQAWRAWRTRGAALTRMHFEALEPRVLMSAEGALVMPPQPESAQVDTTTQRSGLSTDNARIPPVGGADTLPGPGTASVTPAAQEGTLATVLLTGPGTATLTEDAGRLQLTLLGTSAQTSVQLVASGAEAQLVFSRIDVAGEVGQVDLSIADLQGTANFGGGFSSLQLRGLESARITHGGSGAALLQASQAVDTVLQAGGASLSVDVGNWSASAPGLSAIEAAALSRLDVAGRFGADIDLSGQGVSGYVLGTVRVGGALEGGRWNVEGRGNAVSAGSIGAAWRGNFSGTLAQLGSRGDASGQLSAAGLQMLQVGGSLRGMTVLIGADLGADAALGGTGADADRFAAGTLARLRVTGDVIDSRVLVGIDPVNGVLLDGDDRMLGSATQRVQELAVGGGLLGSTVILAPAFPAAVRVNGQTVSPASLQQLATAPRDVQAPVLTAALLNDTGRSASDGITRDATLVLRATEAGGIARWQARLAGSGSFAEVAVQPQADGSVTVSATALEALLGRPLVDGEQAFELQVLDRAGNFSNTASVAFTLRRQAPAAATIGLDEASDTGPLGDLRTTADLVRLVGIAESGVALSLRRSADDAELAATEAAGDGRFSFAGVALALGSNGFTLRLTDAAGNVSTQTFTLTRDALVVDGTPPTLTAALQDDTGRSAGDRITANPAVSGRLTDDVALGRLLVALDPAAADAPYTDLSALLQPDGRFTLDAAQLAALAGAPGGTLADGSHTLRLKGVDAAGNESAAQELSFTLDTRAPTGATLALAPADALPGEALRTSAGIVTLRGLAEAGTTVALPAQGLSTVAGLDGSYLLSGVTLALGDNLLQLQVTDVAGNRQTVDATLTRVQVTQQDAVLTWIDITLQAIQADVTDPAVATRTLALVSLAQYDTLAAAQQTPAYLVQLRASGAVDVQAATAVAAHRVLSLTYPAQKAALDAALASSLAAVPAGAAKDTGIALGLAVADAVLAARANDGSQAFSNFTGSQAVGQWRPTGPMYDVPELPSWGQVQPFALSAPNQFRRDPPPALDTAAYADAVNEIKALGRADSSVRTADQTEQAHFWADGKGSYTPPGHWNQIARQVAAAEGNSLSANALLFAQLNVALADAAIACWDTKYAYTFWRPDTAIQNADLDGNAATMVDAAWRSLLINPAHPDYVSGHSTFSAAASAVLAATFGDDTAFSTTSATLPGVTRSFTSFSQAAEEAGRSRVYGGIHFEFSNAAGKALGAAVGAAVLERFNRVEDVQPPVVSTDALPAATQGNVTLRGQVLDTLSGVAAAQFRIDQGDWQTLVLDAQGRFSVSTPFALDGGADGVHTVTIVATDAAGNQSAEVTRSFTLDTRAPTITLASVAEGDALTSASRLVGSAGATGSTLAQLSYRIDGGSERSIAFDATTGAFDSALLLGDLAVGDHSLLLSARDAAGNVTTLTRGFRTESAAPFTISELTPGNGSRDVGVTQRPLLGFSRPVNVATLTADSFYATGPDGARLATTIVPAADGSYAWLFFDQPMPGGARVTVHVDGSKIRAASDGRFLDADGDGSAGGVRSVGFTTVSTTTVAGTRLVGRVVDPGADLEPMTFDDIRRGADGVIHTADDVFLNPIANAKVWILGREDQVVYTDAQGRFELTNVPVGNVKVAIDGRTATNAPTGVFWPEMVMDANLRAGVANTLMGSMGSLQEQLTNADRTEVYLPRIATSVLQPVSATEPTVIRIPDAAGAPALSEQERAALTLTVPPGSAVGDNGQPLSDVRIGIATVPPELVRDMLPPGVMQHTFDITIQAPGVATFAQPVQITFPNVFNAAPGTKLNILSFDHTTGRLVINGTGTVSADGLTVVSDEGAGVRAPGWHGMTPPGTAVTLPTSSPATPTSPCDPVGIGLSFAGLGLGAAAIALAGTVTAPVTLGLGLAGAAVGAYDAYRQWDRQSTAERAQSAAEFTATGVIGTGLGFVPQESRRTVTTITNLRYGLATETYIGSKPSVAAKLGKALGWLGVGLSLRDLYSRIGDCLTGDEGQQRQLLASNATTQTAPQKKISDFLSAQNDAAERMTAALEKFFNGALESLVPPLEKDAFLTMEGSQIKFLDVYGESILSDTGLPVAISLNELISKVDLTSNTTRDALLEYSVACGAMADAYKVLPDIEELIDDLTTQYERLIEHETEAAAEREVDGDDLTFFAITDQNNEVVLRGTTRTGLIDAFLPANSRYLVSTYGYYSQTVGFSTIETGVSGTGVATINGSRSGTLASFTVDAASPDADSDGLPDAAEWIIGTNLFASDSDRNGISDKAQLDASLAADASFVRQPGIVGAVTLGAAEAVEVISVEEGRNLLALVATGVQGLALIDIRADRGELLTSVSLLGNAVDVSADADRRIAAVAGSDAGLHLVDIANPAAPRLIQTTLLDGPALGVEVRNGYAYVIHGSKLSSIDLNTGDLRQTLDLAALGGGALTDIAIDGDTVYTLDSQRTLRAVSVGGGSMVARGGLGLAAGGGKLFVGGGVAYVGRDDGFSGGFSTVDVRDAANLVLLSGVDAVNLGGRAIAANGSGLAVSVGNPGGVFGTFVLDVVNVSDPTDTGRFVTRVTLPQAPRDLVLANGLAFVADGSGGLQIVNYLAADNKGVPPTVAIVVDGVDADPATPGIQVLEGRTLRILPTLSDDVQVRHIELLVNGNVVATDVSFPYELFAQAPALAAGATSGTVTVQVRAIDTGGNVGLSDLVTLSVVPDTFAPVVTAISVDEGARRFFVRTIDIDFDEPIDVTRLDASQVQLLRAGADGVFDTPDDVAVAVRIDSRSFGQSISVLVDGLLPAGDYRLRLPGSLIADRAGNVASASIERRFTVRPASDVKATQGVPEIATAPSANPGQSIGFAVPFDPTTARASFRVADANGNQSNQVVNASRVDAAQGIAFFTVPLNAVSGDIVVYGQVGNVRTDFADGTLPLQIVPVVSGVEVQSVSSDGATAVVVLRGLGFVEGGNSEYRFGNGAVVVADAGANTGPDVQQVYDPAFAQYVNGQVVLTVPLANGVFGPISVKTAGGTSAVFTVSLDRVASTALSGTPADAAQASANPGQSITLEGTGLSTATDVLLRYTDYNGALRMLKVNPIAASADGLSATLVVPLEANGAFTLQVFGSASQPLLQIVPVLTRLDVDGGVVGAGFVEGGTTFALPGITLTDSAANAGPDVTYWYDPSRGTYIYGGYASLPAQVLPRHGLGSMTVTTAGGTSAAIDLSTLRPGTDTQAVGSLADVAMAADGSLWTLDVNNPGHLLRINASTGAVVQTITLDADTFGNQYTGSYAGLQVLPSATTLAGINVPAGSLLLISGYQYNSAPQAVAVNPATGEVIARLAIGPHGLVAGMLDPSTGQLLVLTTTDRLLALDRTTGAQISEVALPVNLGGWAGLALDPDDGQLWIGSGRLLVQIDRAGTERKRIDLTPQGFTGEVSGLAFAADGSLRVASSQGYIQRVLPAADVTATLAPTLTQVIGAALNGVAAQANVAAANVGQTIELVGTNFGAGTQVLFNVRNAEGIESVVAVRPLLINADGTRLQVVVPDLATTGGVRVSNVGTTHLAYGSPADSIHRRITTSFVAGGDSAVIRFADGGLQALNDESWGLDNVVLRQGGSIVFQDNFEAGAKAGWSSAVTDSQAGFSRFAGRFNNTSQSLSVSGLVAGQTYELSFDLYAFDSWDGTNGNPDQISVSVDGSTVLSRTVSNELADPQTVNASAALRLQIVPTLTGLSGGRPGEDDDFNLVGSGFMEGATTVTIGGVPFVDANRSTSPFDVSGTRNGSLSVVAPLTLDGPIRVTTEGGYAELPTAAFGQQPVVQFNRIVATVDPALGLPADATQPAAVTGQTIVLQGQGFTSGTLVQFQGVDDSGRLGTLTRSGTVGNNGTTLTVVVPALARTGNVTVLGSSTSLALQVLPTLRAAGGSVQAGQVLLIEGSGLTRNDLAIQVDGRGVGSFSVQTVNDGPSTSYADQQLLRIVLPAGVGGPNGGVITVSTAGGTAVLRTMPVASTALPALTPADAGNTLATAQPVTLGLNQNLRLTGSIGTTADVDLYQLTLAAGEQLSLSVTGNQPVALRLFAADGTPLVSTQRWVNDATVLRWTAPAAGVVYVGLSGYNNTTYDPTVAGSGTNGGYTGNHTLVMERLAAGSHRLGAISSTALSGTPASAGVASANTGQTITLSGLGLQASDRVVFTLLDDAGRLVTSQPLAPASVADDGSSLTVAVPLTATTGMVRLERDTTGVLLQIVPTLGDVVGTVNGLFAGGNVTLSGTGFAESGTTVLFGNQPVQDVSRSRGLDVYGNNTQLNLTVPEGLATGPLRVSTVGGTSAAYGLVLTGVQSTATAGSPSASGRASANPGQTVTLLGSGFDLSTDIVFTIVDANGQLSERLGRPAVVNAQGTQLQVTVPLNAVTGSVRVVGDLNGAALPLQIVPVVTGVQVQSVSSDGATAVVVLTGRGFVEGNNSEYRFGAGASGLVITDAGASAGPDVQQLYDPALAQYVNGQVVLTVPLSNGAFGPISVKTAGGTSAVFTVSLDRVTSTALSGTPADAAQASANPGQSITLEGTGLSTATDVLLRYTDYNGALRMLKINPSAAAADGTSATLVVPLEANGAFTLQVFGSASQPLLQIVPVLTRLDADGGVVGAGFVEGGTTFALPGITLTDSAANAGPDVTYWYDPSRGAYIYGGYASLPAQVLPRHGLGAMTVTTAGGTSAAIDLSTLRPGTDTQSVGSLADVAMAADGSLWTMDVNNPGHLLRINAGTGAVVQTITLDADTFGNQYTGSYAGLQVLPSATTLAGINVPAGSLLLISGYQYNAAPQAVAVNPANGEVIARLAIGPHGLVAGMLDPSTGQLLVLTTTDRLLALDRTTGAQLSEVALPVNLGGWAGLALDPDDGQLWIGSGRLLVQIDRAGSERRRIDLTPQGFTGEVSGLAFAADGSLWVASSQGFIQRVLPAADVTATLAPTLTQVIGSALNGVAAQANVAAANVGQTIELVGTNFGAGTQVLFNVRNAEGIESVVAVRPLLINADGTRLQVVVPDLATTGGVRVSNVGTTHLAYGSPADAIHRRITTSFVAGGDSAVIRFADGGLQALNDESWGLDNVVLRQGGSIVFQDNFEAGAKAGWSSAVTDSQAGFSRFAGRFNNTSQSLSVSGLVAGQTYELSFDLYAFDSWDGTNGNPDQISVSVDGSTVLSRTVSNELADPQTVNASAALRLQIVPTLTGLANGRPGEDDEFTLQGSGFMEGASTVTIGGVVYNDAVRLGTPFDVTGANSNLSVLAPLALDGPVRISTEGGYADWPSPVFGTQPLVQFDAIEASVDPGLGLPANATLPAAVTGQTIVLRGQGFTNGTLVQFQGVDDSGRLGTITRTGTAGSNGTTLTVVVPALARSGAVTVLGSDTPLQLQVLPTLRAVGGTLAEGNTLVLEGTGLTPHDLAVQIDGRGVGAFTLRTVNDGPSAAYADQQLLRIVVPAGTGGGVITVSTAGGTAVLRLAAASVTALPNQTVADAGNTLATAQPVTLGLNQNLRLTGSIGTATDVDLYQLTLAAGEQLSLSVTGNQPVALRLFAADGTPLLSTQRWVNDGTVLRWTAPAAGVVYVGLSGYNNTTYDPAVAGSGTNGGYTGNHTLVMERLAPGSHRVGNISATALSGTPASAGVASANTGQTITLSGLGLQASDRVVFTLLDDAGRLVTSQPLAPASVAADGSSLTVVVPLTATTGMVRLERDTTGVLLQIVPTLGDVVGTVNGLFAGGNVTLSGTGFAEGGTTVLFGSQAIQDVGRSRGLDVYGNNTQLNLTVPEGLATGPLRVSTVGGTSAAFGLVLTGVQSTATAGSPSASGQASANPGQTVTLLGSGFDLSTDIVFTIVDANGQFSERLVRPAVVNQAGTELQVMVPLNAVTGSVRLLGDLNGAALPLQIVPVVTGVQVQSVSGDGATAVVVLTGRGFVEGNNSEYRFGAGASGLVITDAGASAGPDVQQLYDPALAQYVNGQVVLTVPLSNGAFGPIAVKTAGGTSAVFTVSLDRITATALSGTPADATQASANPGQSVTLEGTGLSTATDVLLRYTDYNGALRTLNVNPIAASADGLSATLVVPLEANGAFSLQVFGSAAQPLLQIVPVLTRLDADGGVVGAGFVEGGTTFVLPGITLTDSAANAGPDVTYWYDPSRGAYIYGGYADLTASVLPRHGLGSMTVRTAGGTSAAITLSTLRPGTDTQAVGSLADVAVAADGSLWTLDVNNPGHLLRINAGTGAVVQTITLDADTFGNQYTGSYAGLQMLPSATTLAGINVPAGSLLLISGYQYNSAPQAVAVNPANGEVIARLAIGPHGLVAGLLDPSTGQLLVLTTTDRLLALDRTTGAQISEVALPVNLGGWAGLALDPNDGQLWIGSGRLLVQIDRAGTERRRIDLAPQGFTGEISGLAFAADGSLRVASSQGYIQRVVLPAPVNRVAVAPGARLAPPTVALPAAPQTTDVGTETTRTTAGPAPTVQSSAFRVTSEWLRREGVLRQVAKTGGWGVTAAAGAQRTLTTELLKPAAASSDTTPTAALPPLVGIGRLSTPGVNQASSLPPAWADQATRAAAQLLLRATVPSSTARGR